jgi:SAM-dependent methyltransferase
MYNADLAHIHDCGFVDFSIGVAPHIARVLARAGIDAGLVVEIGCGSGRLARYLTELGYDVEGFDVSRTMIRIARAHAPRARLRTASLTDARIPSCDAVIAVGEVVTYVRGGLPTLSRFFRRAHDALRPGGMFVLDFIESARGRTYPTKTKAGAGWAIAVRADYAAASRILTRRMTMSRRVGRRTRRSRETHRIRIYSRREIRSALTRAGFGAITMKPAFGGYRLMRSDVAVVAIKRPLG